jgi:hypothetical protein
MSSPDHWSRRGKRPEDFNVELFRYCQQQGITFTRSRPYRKNDNCFVEQKNWARRAPADSYGRYDTTLRSWWCSESCTPTSGCM